MVAGLGLLAGCASVVPLGSMGDAVVDADLIGTWIEVGQGADGHLPGVLSVQRREGTPEYQMAADVVLPLRDSPSTVHLDGFSVLVKGARFLSVRESGDADAEWLIYRYERESDDGLQLWRLRSETTMAAQSSPAALLQYVADRLDQPGLFEEDPVRLRKRGDEA
jgi:hypothetical protein